MKKRGYGGGGLILRGKAWYIKYSYKGVQVMRSAETEDRATAEAKLNDVMRLMQQGAKPFVLDKVTIGDLVALVLADYELHRKKSADIVRDRAKKHVIPAFGRVKVRNFGTVHLTEYIAKRRSAGAADATINRELAIVRRGFSLGEQNQPPMVLRKVYIPALTEDNTREGFIDRPQYKRLCTALPERLRCLFVVGYHLGLRLSTLRAMKWEQVDFTGAVIRIPKKQTKQKVAQTVPIYGEMRAWLEMAHAAKSPKNPYVFQWKGKRIGEHLDGWREAVASVGLPELHFHDLRRSAVRNFVRAGVPQHVAMRITGHQTASMFRRYDIVDERDIAEAGEKIVKYFKTVAKTVAKDDDSKGFEGVTQ